jgi:Asp-tRNA(Asn)/Glu-tRNA(Gln) amidotransferase A subunit family amidase
LRAKNGLPLGVQIVARRYDDYKLLAFAKMLADAVRG